MSTNSKEQEKAEEIRWQPIVAKYAKPDMRRSLWQVANTLIPYFVLWGLMVWSIQYSYWITLGLSVFAAGFLMRTFIIFHDCGHGSFFKSRKANDWIGRITGFLNFTPYYRWKHDHAIHHATAGDLDRRGTGDVYTMTVKEYLAAPWWMKSWLPHHAQPIFPVWRGPAGGFPHHPAHPGRPPREGVSVPASCGQIFSWSLSSP